MDPMNKQSISMEEELADFDMDSLVESIQQQDIGEFSPDVNECVDFLQSIENPDKIIHTDTTSEEHTKIESNEKITTKERYTKSSCEQDGVTEIQELYHEVETRETLDHSHRSFKETIVDTLKKQKENSVKTVIKMKVNTEEESVFEKSIKQTYNERFMEHVEGTMVSCNDILYEPILKKVKKEVPSLINITESEIITSFSPESHETHSADHVQPAFKPKLKASKSLGFQQAQSPKRRRNSFGNFEPTENLLKGTSSQNNINFGTLDLGS